jgi:hypothetical protein
MHDPDKDSEEFVRNRFDQDFPSVSADAHRNVEVAFARDGKGNGRLAEEEDAVGLR